MRSEKPLHCGARKAARPCYLRESGGEPSATSIAKGLCFGGKRELAFQATAHEDNQGALKLANLEDGRNTPRSKFYALRLHWFRSWLHRPLGWHQYQLHQHGIAEGRHAY